MLIADQIKRPCAPNTKRSPTTTHHNKKQRLKTTTQNNSANEAGEDPLALAGRFIDEFHADMAALGCLPPTVRSGGF